MPERRRREYLAALDDLEKTSRTSTKLWAKVRELEELLDDREARISELERLLDGARRHVGSRASER